MNKRETLLYRFLIIFHLFLLSENKQTYPIVGIIMKPIKEEYPELNLSNSRSVIESSYVMFLEQAGARVIPIDYTLSDSEIYDLMNKTDCAFFPGGDSNLTLNTLDNQQFTPLFKTGQIILKKSIDLFYQSGEKNESYPIWGTCLGHELVLMGLANSTEYLQKCNNCLQYPAVLNFSTNFEESNIFSNFPKIDIQKLKNVPLTNNWHHYSVNKSQFNNADYPNVSKFLKIITESPSKDFSDLFVSSTEGQDNLPIYTVQYHPELWNYEVYSFFPHSNFCSELSFEYSLKFVKECRKRMDYKNRSDDSYSSLNSIYRLKKYYSEDTGLLFYY